MLRTVYSVTGLFPMTLGGLSLTAHDVGT